jgi:hypothetical protein
MRSRSWSLNPTGMHSSRKLQLEQATLMADGFMGTTCLDEQQTLIQRKVKNEP